MSNTQHYYILLQKMQTRNINSVCPRILKIIHLLHAERLLKKKNVSRAVTHSLDRTKLYIIYYETRLKSKRNFLRFHQQVVSRIRLAPFISSAALTYTLHIYIFFYEITNFSQYQSLSETKARHKKEKNKVESRPRFPMPYTPGQLAFIVLSKTFPRRFGRTELYL